MTKDQNMEDTTQALKSCIVAHKGGVPQDNLDDEFFKLTGSYIPYLRLGFNSLYEFMGSIKEVIKKRNDDEDLVYVVSEPKIAHIAEMVSKQKDSSNRGRHYTKTHRAPKRKATSNYIHPGGRRRAEKKRKIYHRRSFSDEENLDVISDHEQSDDYSHPVKIMERPQKMDVVCQPIVNGKQLIGDDFFLQLAIRNIGTTIWRDGPCTALHSGLCKSGQTIRDCLKTLKTVESLTNRLVIMLGTEDIYEGRSSDQMINDMKALLDYLEVHFSFSRSAITLCTIPPMANLSMVSHRKQLMALERFNHWIRERTTVYAFNDDNWNPIFRYHLVDFHSKNTTVRGSTEYEYFQLDARMVSGTSYPYVLWSQHGRRLAMNLLRAGGM